MPLIYTFYFIIYDNINKIIIFTFTCICQIIITNDLTLSLGLITISYSELF